MTHIVFDSERQEYLLDMLDIELDENNRLIDGDSGEVIESMSGEEITIDEVGYFKREDGEAIPVKDEVSNMLRDVKDSEGRTCPKCPECGEHGQMSRGPDLFFCPECEVTYDSEGSTDVPQFDTNPPR